MAVWKKVIVSGSIAELNTVSASLAVVVGANGYNKIGTNQSSTVLSGSFTGSFKGDGSGLTGLVTTLGITGSDSSIGSVDLLTQGLTVQGATNEINTTISGQTLTIGLIDNPVITGDITIGGNDIKSNGGTTAITLNGDNVEVKGDLQVSGNDIKSSTGVTNITLTAGTLTAFAGDIKVGNNNISSSTDTAIKLNGTDVEVRGDLQVSGNDIKASNGDVNITLTNATLTTFAGDIKVGGNDIQASDGQPNITLASNTLTTFAGDIKVGNNTISSSTDTAIELSGTDVEIRGDLTVGGNDIKSSTNATAITLSGANVSMPANLSVAGDLTVNGDLTYLNVENLLVQDKFILLNSGSENAPSEGGIIIDQGGLSGSAFAWDTDTIRWGFTGSLSQNATSFVPDAFVAAVVTNDDAAVYRKAGNIRVEAGEIYIYV